jgi:hypothetical protein
MTPDDLRYIKSVVADGLCCEPAILGDLVQAYDAQAARLAALEAALREALETAAPPAEEAQRWPSMADPDEEGSHEGF